MAKEIGDPPTVKAPKFAKIQDRKTGDSKIVPISRIWINSDTPFRPDSKIFNKVLVYKLRGTCEKKCRRKHQHDFSQHVLIETLLGRYNI